MKCKDKAAECLKKVIREDPKDEFAYTRLIKLKFRRQKWGKRLWRS